ncbi:MAG: hypothetical protein EA377_13360 [Phycisphaerales bacterium]|nr:MAG: hypothetical protein EA377_13360 [Phycisphaerales bacterium]
MIVNDANPNQVISETGLNNVFGGTRTTEITLTNAGIPQADDIRISVFMTPGIFDYRSTSEASGFLSLTYDAGGAGLGIDLSNQIGLDIDFLSFDLGNGIPMPVTATVSDGMNSASLEISLTSAGAQVITFDFMDFSNIGSVDLSAIQSISFDFDAGNAADFRIDQIVTTGVIPAPGALALLGIAGLLGMRRRRA